MSLDVYLEAVPTDKCEVFHGNITHNLGRMADEAGIYDAIWKPGDMGITKAKELIPLLDDGLKKLESDPVRFNKLNPENGWGTYSGLIEFVREYLKSCRKWPEADVTVWR